MSLYGAVRCHRLLSRMNFTLGMNSVIEPCTSGCTPDRIQLANHSSMCIHYIHCVRLPFEVRSSIVIDMHIYLFAYPLCPSCERTLVTCISVSMTIISIFPCTGMFAAISFRLSSGLSLSDWTTYYLVNAKVTVSI